MTLDDLLRFAPLFQVVAYISLTLTTIIVGIAALIFTYRNNFGWKPRCLHIKDGFGHPLYQPEMWTFLLTFDVWNMRKYPIAIKSISVRPTKLRFNTETIMEEWEALTPEEISRTSNWRQSDIVLAPVSSQTIEAEGVFVDPGDTARVFETVVVTVTYFDPRKKKMCIAKLRYKHGFYQPKRFRWF